MKRTTITGTKPVPDGKATVRMEFAYDGGGLAKGGLVTLLVNGKKVGGERIEQTIPMMYSTDEGADVGVDEGTPVVEDYQPRDTKFTGTIRKIVVDVKAMGAGEKAESKKATAETAQKIAEAR